MLNRPDPTIVTRLLRMALEEDAPWGDLTSQTLLPAQARVTATLVAREPGTLSGQDLFTEAMRLTSPEIVVTSLVHDGERFEAGALLAKAYGSAQSILQAERIALNFIQRLSGIATLTARYVAATAGTHARIVDTRKTTPGLRYLERYAVRCGGGANHRYSLSDAVLVKDNHLAVLANSGQTSLTAALRQLRSALSHTTHLEVEIDSLEQLDQVLAAEVDTILLDNFSLPDLRTAVTRIAGRALSEASGSVNLDTVAHIAGTGVDLISVGALTHSVRSLDLGLDILPEV